MTIDQTGMIESKLPIKTTSPSNEEVMHKKIISKNTNPYLNLSTIQKILNKILTEKNMPRANLAEVLGLKPNELEAIINNQVSSELIIKVNLPLIKLFCGTKFNN